MSFTSLWITIPLIVIGLVISVFIFQWLWNTTMPEVFGLKKITIYQAIKILFLSLVLTGGGSSLFSMSTTDTKTIEGVATTNTLKFGLP
ncbi:hypothetical protein [Methylomonas sp. UP202]|uniref:hypothetical protein n=1 Tax=Methylomonas sp. UP202 TaxID=3040943 RepID=UPI00143B49BC|nr:hypothetical protein [Methylomonas sp. UP202]NJA06649.1 hypothetical protein [Methylococcaceae bacterium WWC4]WGS86918.1 hypothetical protein QC632_03980 [Methylomonas sp. UP202]